MKFDKILVSGCSFTAGFDMPNEHYDEKNWPMLLSNKLGTNNITNVAKTGANNHWIFLETISAMLQDTFDLILVQWSAIPRYNFNVGLELYPVDTMLNSDVNIVAGEVIKKEWLMEIKRRLLKIQNDHWDILDLVKYVNVLIELQARARQGKIFFINGLVPWSTDYFLKKQINLPSDLDQFICNLLQVNMRDDDEIFQLYDMIHEHYLRYGGIQENYWLNLYQPMTKLQIDNIRPGDLHPGYQSQVLFADYFAEKIKNKCEQPQS